MAEYLHFIDRPQRQDRSKVAITRGYSYYEAERMVREALDLLDLGKKICAKGENILIKPNLVFPAQPEAADTTHPAVVAAMVRICKERGARVSVGDGCAWHFNMDMVWEQTGVRQAALDAGADRILNFNDCERVEVEVPGGRSLKTLSIPRDVTEADAIINIPKMKNNFVTFTTLAVKNMLGLMSPRERHQFHRTPVDMAWAVNDIFKAVIDKHRLTLIDGIVGLEGATHLGSPCNPGVIVASKDPIAVEAIGNVIMGYHPFESPHVQVGMKDGLGTGELSEIEVVGAKLQDVIYPFQRSMLRFVSRYANVTEYYGGVCPACLWVAVSSPPVICAEKKYAVISGSKAFIASDLKEYDELWLIGECACSPRHQFSGYAEKIKAAKKTVRIPTCPAMEYACEENMGGVYDIAADMGMPDLFMMDGMYLLHLPDNVAHGLEGPGTFLGEITERKEGRRTTWP